MERLDTFNRLAKLRLGDDLSRFAKIGLMTDVLWERLRYGTELQDYFQYEFYNLKNHERRKYMTYARLRYTMGICNDPSKREHFDDKALFNRTFSEYLYRDWLDVTTATYEEFDRFVSKYPAFFAKARIGMFGKGAGKYETEACRKETERKKLYDELVEKGCIIEQLIQQHPLLERFNESSVNTLRVVTFLCADGKPKVMAGVLRIGRTGKIADNFHHHGIAVTVDPNTGIVNSLGIDNEFKRYIVHPDSGEQIIGFKIPSWDRVVELVRRDAMVIPEVRYIGWDVAVDSEGAVQLIEGNYGADPDVTQMPCRLGKWPAFENEIRKIILSR